MNRFTSLVLATLIACPAAQAAVAITTNPVCKKLVTAIEQAHNVESCKAGWHTIVKSTKIKTDDHPQVIAQALRLAHEQKAVFEEELTNLDNKAKDYSKIKWGAGQLALGIYLAAGAIGAWTQEIFKLQQNKIFQPVIDIVFPEDFMLSRDSTTGKILETKTNTLIMTIGVMHMCIFSHLVGPYLTYKGYKNIKQGLHYKQILHDKITNLDAIIAYLQDLQTNNQ